MYAHAKPFGLYHKTVFSLNRRLVPGSPSIATRIVPHHYFVCLYTVPLLQPFGNPATSNKIMESLSHVNRPQQYQLVLKKGLTLFAIYCRNIPALRNQSGWHLRPTIDYLLNDVHLSGQIHS